MKECNVCHRPNNDTAIYCKWCGKQFSQKPAANPASGLATLVGKDAIVT